MKEVRQYRNALLPWVSAQFKNQQQQQIQCSFQARLEGDDLIAPALLRIYFSSPQLSFSCILMRRKSVVYCIATKKLSGMP